MGGGVGVGVWGGGGVEWVGGFGGGGGWRGGVRTKPLIIRNIITPYFRTASLYFPFLILCYTATYER